MIVYDQATAVTYSQHRVAQTGVLQTLPALEVAWSGARVLEVGCGTVNHLAGLCMSVACVGVGIDPAVSMLRKARVPPGSLVSAVTEAMSFTRSIFGLVSSVDVAHHLLDLDVAFSGMGGVLSPACALSPTKLRLSGPRGLSVICR